MQKIPQISDAEWTIMQILWENKSSTANDIIAVLKKTTDWKPTTIKTLLSRLVKKQAVGFEEKNRTYHYYPLLSEDECIKEKNQSFLKRIYGGALKTMIVNFLETETLSEKDIDELKQILDEKK